MTRGIGLSYSLLSYSLLSYSLLSYKSIVATSSRMKDKGLITSDY